MNRISNVLLSAAVAITGFSATARTMTKPRVETRPGVAVEVRPTARTSPAENIVREGTPANVEQLRGAQYRDQNGNSCSAEDYASKIVQGTSVSYADGLSLIKDGYMTMGTCGAETGGFVGYSADARETLLLASLEVRKANDNKAFRQVSVRDYVKLSNQYAVAMANAKNRNGGNKFSAETERATIAKISASQEQGGCGLIPAM